MYFHDGLPGKNVWPDINTSISSEMKERLTEYYEQVNKLGHKLLRLFAISLKISPDKLSEIANPPSSIARILHYPPQQKLLNHDQLGIGAHTDYELFTVLLQQQGVKALQVLNSNNEWISADPIEGTLIVNVADMMQRLTNNLYVSTIHRAINISGVERYSSPVFFGANYDAVIKVNNSDSYFA